VQELSPAELAERERGLRKLREELRNEEMKLVLLKKLRQSQQMKENIAVVPPSQQPSSKVPPPGKLPPPPQQQPPPPLVRTNHTKQPVPNIIPPLLRGVSLVVSVPQIITLYLLTGYYEMRCRPHPTKGHPFLCYFISC
jgi:hypothetical protein